MRVPAEKLAVGAKPATCGKRCSSARASTACSGVGPRGLRQVHEQIGSVSHSTADRAGECVLILGGSPGAAIHQIFFERNTHVQ
jgi:hypothetical protein